MNLSLAKSLNRHSVATMTAIARAFFAPNFYASRRGGRCEINFVVPGHTLMMSTAGSGDTWVEALAKAVQATGVKPVAK